MIGLILGIALKALPVATAEPLARPSFGQCFELVYQVEQFQNKEAERQARLGSQANLDETIKISQDKCNTALTCIQVNSDTLAYEYYKAICVPSR